MQLEIMEIERYRITEARSYRAGLILKGVRGSIRPRMMKHGRHVALLVSQFLARNRRGRLCFRGENDGGVSR